MAPYYLSLYKLWTFVKHLATYSEALSAWQAHEKNNL